MDLTVVWDIARVVEIILAVLLAASLARVALRLHSRKAVRWRTWFVASLALFAISAALNGIQRFGADDVTPRLFLNLGGLVFGIMAARHFMTFSEPNDKDDQELDAL